MVEDRDMLRETLKREDRSYYSQDGSYYSLRETPKHEDRI